MANPWSILGLRKSCDDEQLWHGYAATLRQASEDGRRRARDAFEAIELGLWGRFADSIEPELPDPTPNDETRTYDGPLVDRLAALDHLLSDHRSIDEIAVRDQIERLFGEPAMQQASTYLLVEPAIAALLERHLPRSEPFVLPTLDRFHHLTDQARDNPALARLLDRAEDLAAIEAFESGQGDLGQGWRPLAKPASRWQRWLWARDDRRSQVAALYAYAGWQNPRLRNRIDNVEWDWWTRELSRERTSFGTLIAWLLGAILMGAAAHRYQAPPWLSASLGAATFAFLLVDDLAARTLIARRIPRPFDGLWTLVFASAALMLPALTRLLLPDGLSAGLVAVLGLGTAWGLRLSTGLPIGVRSSGWPDSMAIPVLAILFFALWLPIPWQRYAMLASYAWLLHAVFPYLRRAVAMSLDRTGSLPWGYLLAGAAALLAFSALFAPALDINRESTRMALLITSYALLTLSVYPRRPFPLIGAFLGSVAIGGYFVNYCQGGGEYHPGPAPSAGEALLSAERGDVLDWKPFPANGEEVLERIEQNNPDAYARLMPIIRKASCDRKPGGGRDCEAYAIDGALYAEVGELLDTMSNRDHVEWTRLEARVREAQFTRGSGACSSQSPQFGPLEPIDIRHDHAALVLAIVSSGPRAPAERPNAELPDLPTFKLAMADARKSVSEIKGGPVHPQLRQACINELVRVRTILQFNADVAARISRGGYPQ